MSCRCFKEITATPSISPRWRDINANTGGSVSTLQDIKVADSAGGYGYRDSGASGSPTRNRFLYWRTSNDVFELVEESLDFNLLQNHVRFRFQDTPILGGITVHEQHGNVIILLVTVASVHRLIFPHPNKLQRFDPGFVMTGDVTLTSILADASVATVCNSKDMHMLSSVTGSPQQTVMAATWLSTDGEAMFAYVTHTGSIVVIKMPSHAIQGVGVIQYELTRSTIMQRFWTGLVPAAIRGEQELSDCPYSLCMHPLGQDIHIFSICRDHKIRIWSTKNQECVSVCDMLEWTTYTDHPQRATVAASGHRIGKLVDHEAGTFRLVVYLGFTEQPLFCILEPMTDERQYHLDHICSVSAPSEELVDFCVSPSLLWSLWTDTEGELIARAATLRHDGQRRDNWVPVLLDPLLSADILIPSHKDPREVYMDEIFRPGRFTMQDIQKALSIYRRSLDSAFADPVSITTLQEDVSAAVETEIQSVAREYELPEEEYCQLQLEQWAKFYSCCIQYHEVGSKSKGVFADSNTGMVGIIRKGGLTYIRPCDAVEQLSLVPTDQLTPADLREMQTLGDDLSLCGDAVQMLECLSLIRRQLTEEMAATFEQELYQCQGPEVIGQQLLEELISLPRPGDQPKLTKQLESHLQMVHRLPDALLKLQCLLELTLDQNEHFNIDDSSAEAGSQLTCSRLFSSEVAEGILSVCVRQMTETRLAAARDLLVVQLFVLHLKDKCGISPDTAEYVKSDSVPQTCLLIRSYFTLLWLTNTVIAPIPANSIEFNLRQLAALDINDPVAVTVMPQQGQQNITLADLFVHGVGGSNARSILGQTRGAGEEPGRSWALSLQPLVTIIAQLLWPYSPSFVLAEMLMGQCQYLHLQDHVRLLADWCLWNAASRAFLLGQCYLNFNEPYKAVESFIDGEKGVSTDEFLLRKLLQTEETDTHRLEVLYYLKVIKLYEQFSIPDLTVTLADTAISKADDDDPNLPTLWSKVFKYQLEMGHNDEAYSAMISNPDASRRNDCLRQFLVVLCERGELQTLVQYQYIDLHDEVVSILESRARSVDLATHNYYDLLYSFHIYRGNYRKAGSVMYEYGRRLGQELPSLKGFQRQAKCYLSALNALRLVNPRYAWIIKPLANTRQQELDSEGTSPKHMWSGEEKTNYCQKVELLEVKDIEKEYLLVNSRLRLLQRDPDPAHITGPTNGPVEMVGLLVNAGLYDQGVAVSQAFGLSISPVVEGLSMRCLQLAHNSFYHMQGDNDYTSSAWDWLGENETKTSYSVKDTTSSADQAWRLLRHYLSLYDDVNGQFHRSVAIKLLSQGFTLPSWFVASYKRLNAPELLRLLIDFDLLEEAGHLALEYIEAVRDVTRGQDREVFTLKGLLQPLPQSVWLPYTCIDQLLIALKDGQSDHVYRKISEELKLKMSQYQQHISSLRDNFHTMVN